MKTVTTTQELENEQGSAERLLAGLVHEINNPLAFLVTNLFMLESGLDALAIEREHDLEGPCYSSLQNVRQCLSGMKEGLNRIQELTNDLGTFSRIDGGEFANADVVETIEAVLLLLKHRMNGRIHVSKNYGPLHILHCQNGRLHQVVMNLVANAVDAIVGKGTVVITTGQSDGFFLISVRDDGEGFPEAIRGKIFEPFFTTKSDGCGTGLGLAITYAILQAHRGSIDVQSEEGVGTEFIVKIPLDLESRRRV